MTSMLYFMRMAECRFLRYFDPKKGNAVMKNIFCSASSRTFRIDNKIEAAMVS